MIQSFLKKHWSVIAWFLVALTFLSVVAYVLNFNLNHKPYEKYVLSDEAADWGTFGDYIGGFVGTIFTMIAALFVWLTYESQKKQLNQAKTSFKEQKRLQEEQLNLAKETAEQQDKTLNQQQFETTFFHMVSEWRKLLEALSGLIPSDIIADSQDSITWSSYWVANQHPSSAEEKYQRLLIDMRLISKRKMGHEFIEGAIDILMRVFNKENLSKSEYAEVAIDNIEEFYYWYHSNYINQIDQYFRFFYNILKFIDRGEIKDKKLYADLLQAQLSKYELALIFYSGIGDIGKPKLFPLIEKYNFLENVNPSTIYLKLYKRYPQITFGFLPDGERSEIIINAMQNNPDKAADAKKSDYYLRKYNRDSKDEITKLIAECEKMEGKEDAAKVLRETLKQY